MAQPRGHQQHPGSSRILPTPLLGHILDYLRIADERNWLLQQPNPVLLALQETSGQVRSHRSFLRLCTEAESQLFLHYVGLRPGWNNMTTLNLGQWATNEMLISVGTRMPRLERIEMVGSPGVSSVLALDRLHRLRYVNVTFCDGVSYEDTLTLRERLPDGDTVLTVRRQPTWCDGRFQTPFENDGEHTYWPDGSFRFQRDNCSRGFVRSMQPIGDNPFHVKLQIQPNNFKPPLAWPAWTKFVFRPAVTLLYSEKSIINNPKVSERPCVLVAQLLAGNRALDDWPRPEHWSLPLGKSVYFLRGGKQVQEENTNHEGDNDDARYVMVTRIAVVPLEAETPPGELLVSNRQFLQLQREQWPTFRHSDNVMEQVLNDLLTEH